jgi:hypothetical protein
VIILPIARTDIQNAIKWTTMMQQSIGLGRSFQAELNAHLLISPAKRFPFFQNRYEEVRCLPLKKFPFMAHFTVNEKAQQVVIHAVFHTSLHPKAWKRK